MSFVCDLHTPEDVASPAISLYQFSIVCKAFGLVVDFAMEAKPHPCETKHKFLYLRRPEHEWAGPS